SPPNALVILPSLEATFPGIILRLVRKPMRPLPAPVAPAADPPASARLRDPMEAAAPFRTPRPDAASFSALNPAASTSSVPACDGDQCVDQDREQALSNRGQVIYQSAERVRQDADGPLDLGAVVRQDLAERAEHLAQDGQEVLSHRADDALECAQAQADVVHVL